MKELKRNLRFILISVVMASVFFGFFYAVLTLDRNDTIFLAVLCYAGFPIVLGCAAWKTLKDANWIDKGLVVGTFCALVPYCEHFQQNPNNHNGLVITLFFVTSIFSGSSLLSLLFRWTDGSGWAKVRSWLLGTSMLALTGVIPISLLLEYVITGGTS